MEVAIDVVAASCPARCGCRRRCRRRRGSCSSSARRAATFGENVVCVWAWHVRATAAAAPRASRQMWSGRPSAGRSSSGRVIASTCALHRSSMWAAGRYSARRRTISAALTSALSAPNGIEPWPGVPVTRSRRHAMPFSPTLTVTWRWPCVVDRRPAAELGEHVVGVDRVPMVLGHPLGAPHAAGLLVGDAEVDQVALRAGTLRGQVPERDRHRRREVEHVDRAATPHLAVDQLAPERIVAPALGADRHDIGVAHQAQRRRDGSEPSIRATTDAGPARACSARRRARRPRGTARSRSALRDSSPESGVPSLTQRLRISVCSSSVVGPVNSSGDAMRPR